MYMTICTCISCTHPSLMHMIIYVCKCVCVCVYIYIYIYI